MRISAVREARVRVVMYVRIEKASGGSVSLLIVEVIWVLTAQKLVLELCTSRADTG